MGLLPYISYLTAVAGFAFITMSLASGLLYVSELIEEHSRVAKYYGQRGIYAIILLHVLLYFSDSLPFSHLVFSIVCHIIYLQNFSQSWPLISLSSASFVASCVLVILDHFLWFFYFSHNTKEVHHYRSRGDSHYRHQPHLYPHSAGFAEIASFFAICVWTAPLFLFLSLSANDNALPTAAGPVGLQQPQPVSLFRSLFSSSPGGWLGRPRSFSRIDDTQDGLLARSSRSPAIAFSPVMSPQLSPTFRSNVNSFPPTPISPTPPRSPRYALQSQQLPLPTPEAVSVTAMPQNLGGPVLRRPPRRSASNVSLRTAMDHKE